MQRCQPNFVTDEYCAMHIHEAVTLDGFGCLPDENVSVLDSVTTEEDDMSLPDLDLFPVGIPEPDSTLEDEAYAEDPMEFEVHCEGSTENEHTVPVWLAEVDGGIPFKGYSPQSPHYTPCSPAYTLRSPHWSPSSPETAAVSQDRLQAMRASEGLDYPEAFALDIEDIVEH